MNRKNLGFFGQSGEFSVRKQKLRNPHMVNLAKYPEHFQFNVRLRTCGANAGRSLAFQYQGEKNNNVEEFGLSDSHSKAIKIGLVSHWLKASEVKEGLEVLGIATQQPTFFYFFFQEILIQKNPSKQQKIINKNMFMLWAISSQ